MASLRGFRKAKDLEKGQTSMLRFVRPSQSKPRFPFGCNKRSSETDSGSTPNVADSTTSNSNGASSSGCVLKTNGSTEQSFGFASPGLHNTTPPNHFKSSSKSVLSSFRTPTSRTFIVKGSSPSSPHRLDAEAPLPHSSRLFYVKPLPLPDDENSEDMDGPTAKESGFDISSVLKEKSPQLHTTNGHHSDDSNHAEISNVSQDGFVSKINYNKRLRIESDDEENGLIRVGKRACVSDDDSLEASTTLAYRDPAGKFSPEMIEKLIETYGDLYPTIEKMELYETMEEWNYNFSEMTRALDTKVKEQKKKKDRVRASEVDERKQKKLEEREQQKKKKAAEVRRKKTIWRMKARFHEQENEDEEEDYIGKKKVYESDSEDEEDDDEDGPEEEVVVTPARTMVLEFFNDSPQSELSSLPGCSKRKVAVIMACRPFASWRNLVYKFKTERYISTDLLNKAKDVIQMRNAIKNLMRKCEKISAEIQTFVSEVISGDEADCMNEQPKCLNPDMTLKNYQLIGLNWLTLMHDQQLNCVLADEMGLGKTIQAISFLAYLKDRGELEGRFCLIVVPTSTLDNWARELEIWLPSLRFLTYHGSQDERRGMRMDIMNDEMDENVGVILTTYNMVTSSSEDKGLFKKLPLHTIIYDEAHMLKNMTSQRYENLMKIRCLRRVLLTGTPLQNNLVELMSILIFVMPQLFEGRKEELKKVFSMFPKNDDDENKGRYERERILQAKRIMAPFFLRRLKVDVLKDLPTKTDEVLSIPMNERQEAMYKDTVQVLNKRAEQMKVELESMKLQDLDVLTDLHADATTSKKAKIHQQSEDSSSNMLMKLRKLSNHPLLLRNLYTDDKIKEMSRILKKSTHQDSILDYIVEDFSVMSDFDIHKTCLSLKPLSKYALSTDLIVASGKMEKLDEMLPEMKKRGDRVLIFSQFVIVLNLLEEYMKIRGYVYRRLDGSTVVADRQEMIDDFNEDEGIFVFLLSTRAGGLGINLSSANTVVLHDIDFNPYNDKQAEDRCHRVGQTRNVKVYRFISSNSIEQGMYQIACNKLQLEIDVTGQNEEHRKSDVVALLKTALRVDNPE